MEIGLKGRADCRVTYENTAAAVGSGLLEVFSTPSMLALMEKAAKDSLLPYLQEGQGSVGIRLEVSHLAAVPIGETVTAESELTEIDGRILTFSVSARSEKELVGEGTHKRCIINNERFMQKINEKYGGKL